MNTQCILWTKAKNSSGYGVTWVNGRQEYIHRIVAEAQPGEVVLHICDNKLCINPEHLQIGTHADNSLDMVNKNRQARGESCGNSKLTTDQVIVIRALKRTTSSRKVAKMFNISKTNVLDIWNNKIWNHV